jgi:hypothetical protein
VRITRDDTGQSVTGALFRRSADLPGPPFQLSSEAANALNILAGAPVSVSVVALRPATEGGEAGEVSDAPVSLAPENPLRPVARPVTAEVANEPSEPVVSEAATAIDVSDIVEAPEPAVEEGLIAIGTFRDEANARASAEVIRTAGFAAQVVAEENDGVPQWRVVAGPTTLVAMRRLGFVNATLIAPQ